MAFVTRGAVRIHYLDSGKGHPILFHTGGGGDARLWERAGYLQQLPGLRHLRIDPRGRGRSSRPGEPAGQRRKEYVADCLSVLDAAGVERAAMVGYSAGGRVLLDLAARHPERVAALVTIGGVAHPNDGRRGRRPAAGEVRGSGLGPFLRAGAGQESEPPPDWLLEALTETDEEMFSLELEGWADSPDGGPLFPLIEAPTLIIVGEMEAPDRLAEMAKEALPRGEVVVLPRTGPLQAFWKISVTGPIIREFLDRTFRTSP